MGGDIIENESSTEWPSIYKFRLKNPNVGEFITDPLDEPYSLIYMMNNGRQPENNHHTNQWLCTHPIPEPTDIFAL